MKIFAKISTFIMLSFIFTGCIEESIPRNRPDMDIDQSSATETGTETSTDTETTNTFSRPSGAIILQSDHCVCQQQKSIGLGNCSAFCQSKTTNLENKMLYFNVKLTVAITEENLKDVAGFCSTQDGEEANVGCVLQAKDEDGNLSFLNFSTQSGQTSFSVDVGSLSTDETYRISILENASGASSTAIQVRLIDTDDNNDIAGPLALMPVSEYSCIYRGPPNYDSITGAQIIEDATRYHFYFIPETRPEPLKATTLPSLYCHDIEQSPTVPLNSPLLEESTGVFTIWNKADPRFYDLNNSGSLRINEIIQKNVELQGASLTSTPDFFFTLDFPSGMDDGDSNIQDQTSGDSNSTNANQIRNTLGYIMVPFIDDRTYKSYCPTREHYYSTNPIFRAMRDVVGVNTEALYVAKQENVCDNILVREGLISKIWFYEENGQRLQPTSSTISGKKVQFYWPADTSSPYIKKSHQRTYSILSIDELNASSCSGSSEINSEAQNGSGVRTNLPAHDKRIGCIPVLAD